MLFYGKNFVSLSGSFWDRTSAAGRTNPKEIIPLDQDLTLWYSTGGFFILFFMYFSKHCFICRPTDSTVSEDAGIEPRTVATSALIVRRSSHSATSHPHFGYISSTTRLHLIHNSATSHPCDARLIIQSAAEIEIDTFLCQKRRVQSWTRSWDLQSWFRIRPVWKVPGVADDMA